MGSQTLSALISGRITVRVDLRTPDGLAHVAAGRLVDGDRTGNTLRIVDECTGRLRTVRLTSGHVVAYRPHNAARSAA
jgi:hypothetical protein